MLNVVSQVLQEMGLISSDLKLRYYINITTGDSLSISAFVDDEHFLQLKVSEFVDLGPQYDAYCRAWSDYPAFMPRPLGCLDRGGWSIMVCAGVLHTTIRRADVIRAKWRGPGAMTAQLWEYFRGNQRNGSVTEMEGHAALVRDLAKHFEANPLARIASARIADAVALGVESMPQRPQHGDFVLNNLGRAGKRLVVFDWEDYGKVGLPGLDILTLCVSLLEDDADALHRLMDTNARPNTDIARFVRGACEAQGIELTLFRRLVPFYLLVFLYLKRNYGARVQERISSLLRTLSALKESDTHLGSMKQAASRG